MLRSDHRLAGVTALCAVAVLAAGLLWGARTVEGTPTTADIDLATLDFGDLRDESLTEPGNDNDRYGRIIESARMAEAVVDPRDIDADLYPYQPSLLPKPKDTIGFLADVARPILVEHGMLAGYTVMGRPDCQGEHCRDASRSVRVTVLRMPDGSAARAAATAIEAADFAVNPENTAVTLPEYPAAQGHWRPTVPTLGIVVPHESFLVALFVTHPSPDLAALTGLATATLKAELPVLDRFQPTPAAALSDLALDTDGMLRRMVPTEPGEWPYPYTTRMHGDREAGAGAYRESSGVVYAGTGANHWMSVDPRTYGVQRTEIESLAVVDRRWLIRFRDAAAARRAAARESEPSARQTPMAPPRIPDTACLRAEGIVPTYYCVVRDGRYVAMVRAMDEKSVHQMAAAQYALLVRNR
ncbi:Uncharacterised protein [Nocardia otitidiscaviarum]|uniref:Uncharacterized protein n=1 Tax=Nocardia otitidiscaviarum TaxID=1823 RepID=A0A378YQC5_9NOCA|nr:hypothetical protein [Nocardia otitidiscaviarum]SUA78717.1 Uncharacterised protein [Nocardia otitidiscaviarum]